MRIRAKRVLKTAGGGVLCAVGAALLVLPGPGLILVLAGMVLLADEYEWARRLLEPVRVRAFAAARQSVSSPLRIAGSVLAGLALIGAGVAWLVVPWLPFSGVGTGSSLILSGVLLLVLLGYTAVRMR